jgi:ATP-GRASP peptide maturase of grasp-with-spasm system
LICIFSTAVDISTTDVIRWLHHLGWKDVLRVNYNEPDVNEQVRLDLVEGTFSFQIGKRTVRLQDIEAVWYRKGKNWLCDQFFPVTVEHHSRFTAYLNTKLKFEGEKLTEYLHYIIQQSVPVLGTATRGDLNKLLVLAAAREVGLLIPEFYVSDYKEGIRRILEHSPDCITKALSDGLYLFENTETNTGYFSYTEKVDKEMLALMPEYISPSLLQKRIDKKFEARVFYLEGRCYSMAIFSQADERTSVDYRRYNEVKPNRYVPFLLPSGITEKLGKLFKKLDLKTGSVDFIVDHEDNFYFLEINPVGQFGMVSAPCNYYLEKEIALNLIRYARTNRNN